MSGTINLPVLVLGATGIMGRGVIAAAVEARRPVIAVADNPRELHALVASQAGADVTAVTGSLHTDAAGAALAAAVRALHRPLLGVVAALSSAPTRGRLLDHPAESLQHQLDHDLLPHLVAARHLLPMLAAAQRGGSYVLIGGPGSELPWAGYGHRSVAAAAQRMLARVLHDEAHSLAIRVQLLAVDLPVTGECRLQACPHWPSATDVGRRALALVERSDGDATAGPIVAYTLRPDDAGHAASGQRASLPSIGAPAEPLAAADLAQPSSPLPTRCLLDARQLLQTLVPLRSRKPNQESSP